MTTPKLSIKPDAWRCITWPQMDKEDLDHWRQHMLDNGNEVEVRRVAAGFELWARRVAAP